MRPRTQAKPAPGGAALFATLAVAAAAVAAVLAVSAPARAEPAAREDGFLDLLEQENHVYSASRYVQTIGQTPANVTVITRDDLRRFGYRSIAEALASLPGIYDAASQWPAIGVRGFAIPGDFGSRILTLVNGTPVYDATYGSFFVEQLDIQSIERIEFVKGPGSALYGSGAVLGVVNLITRSGRDAGSRSVAVEAATHRSGRLYGSWGRAGDGSDAFLSASVRRSDGRNLYLREFDDPDYDNARFHGMSAGRDTGRDVRLFGRLTTPGAWLQGWFVDADRDDPLASYGAVFNGRLRLRESLGALEVGVQRELGDGTLLTARAYLFDVAEKGDYPYTRGGARVPPVDYINVSDLSTRQLGAEVRVDRFLPGGHHLLAGAELRHVDSRQQVGDQPGPVRSGVLSVDTAPTYSQWGLFLQDEMRAGPGTLTLGARYDSYRNFSEGVSSRLSPRVAYVQEVGAKTTAKLNYGEAYRAPTLYESRYQDGLPAAETLWANPRLRPEVARTWEALLEHQPELGMKWRLSLYRNRLSDTPVQVVTPVVDGIACGHGPESCVQYRNAGTKQTVTGMEADVRQRLAGGGIVHAALGLQRSNQLGAELASSPHAQAKAGYARPLGWAGLDVAGEVQCTSSVLGRIDGAAGGTRTASAPGYCVVHVALEAPALAGGWRGTLRVSNLFDRTYYTIASRELQPLERVPSDGRQVALQLQRDF